MEKLVMKAYLNRTLVIVFFSLCGCFLNPSPTIVHQTDFIELGFSVAEIIDNGEFSNNLEDITPLEYADNHFYLIESPEHLDSIFPYITYRHLYTGAKLEDLFPENGMLLIYYDNPWSSTAYTGHKISLTTDTVSIDVSLTENPNLKSDAKGIYYLIIPIGIIPE